MIALLAWMACELPPLGDEDGDGVTDQFDCDDGDDDVGERCLSKCTAGWGPILEEAPDADLVASPLDKDPVVLHVWSGFEPEEDDQPQPEDDGHVRQPFRELDDALSRAEEIGGPVVIALGPGTYTTERSLYRESEEPATGPRIVGCSPDEVVVRSRARDEPVFAIRSLDLDPFDGSDATWALRIRGLTVEGGRRAIRAIGSVDLTIQDVRVVQAEYYGIQAYGRQVSLDLQDVEVSSVETYTPPFPGALSLGVGVGALAGATLQATRLTIEDTAGAGLVIMGDSRPDAAQRIALTAIRDVVPTMDRFGRGLIADGLMDLRVMDLTVERVFDAGVWVRNAGNVDLQNVLVNDVQPVVPPDGPADGVVLVQDAFVINPTPFDYAVSGVASDTSPARASIVASGSLTVSAQNIVENVLRLDGAMVEPAMSGVPAPPLFAIDLEAFPDDPPN